MRGAPPRGPTGEWVAASAARSSMAVRSAAGSRASCGIFCRAFTANSTVAVAAPPIRKAL